MDKPIGDYILSAWWKNALPESSLPEIERMCLLVCFFHKDNHIVITILGDEFFLGIVGIFSGNVRQEREFSSIPFMVRWQ